VPELEHAKISLTLDALAYSKTAEERSKDMQRLAFVSAELARAGAAVITAPTAPRAAARDALKETVLQSAGPGGNFFTVHIATPLEHCEANDRSGVYTKARTGELKGVAGVDETYEAPSRADLTIDLTKESVSEAVTSECESLLYASAWLTVWRRCHLTVGDEFSVVICLIC
jgi:sulfate adenylyltransferase